MSQLNSVNPTTTTTSTTSTSAASAASKARASALGENDFLKLMMVQLQHQDPLQPSDPTQYLSQLAQFTTVEQITNLAQNSSSAAAQAKTSGALELLGHTVTYTDSNGATQTGTVQKVEFGSSGPRLTINGVAGIDPSAVGGVS